MTPVTDPKILEQLNAGGGMKPVTDPAILEQLNGSQPSFMDRVAASPIGRGLHDFVLPMVGMFAGAPNTAQMVSGPNDPDTMLPEAERQPVIEPAYQGALARNRNTPGYAKERAIADQALAGHGGLGDQLMAPLLPAVAGTAGLLGGLDSSNAMADSQAAAQAGYQERHPVLSFGANVAGGLLMGAPEGSAARIAAAPKPVRLPTLRPGAAEAHDAGYALTPRMMSEKPGLVADAASAWSGKVKTAQAASAKNQTVTNSLAAESLALPADTVLTDEVFSNVRKQAGKAYEAIPKALPNVAADKTFLDEITTLGGANSAAASEFPELMKNPEVESLVSGLAGKQQFPTSAGLELVKVLRKKSSANFRAAGDAQKLELAHAQRDAANAIDDLIDRNLQATATPDLVQSYRSARQLIAKSHDLEAATNTATGNVSARKIAALANRGRPLSGGLDTIAKTANAFPKAMQSEAAFGEVEPLSVLDVAAGLAAAPHNPGLLGAILGRPLARGALLSRPVQNKLAAVAARGQFAPTRLPTLQTPPPLPYGALPILGQSVPRN